MKVIDYSCRRKNVRCSLLGNLCPLLRLSNWCIRLNSSVLDNAKEIDSSIQKSIVGYSFMKFWFWNRREISKKLWMLRQLKKLHTKQYVIEWKFLKEKFSKNRGLRIFMWYIRNTCACVCGTVWYQPILAMQCSCRILLYKKSLFFSFRYFQL